MTVTSYDSPDEMFKAMAEAEDSANEAVLPSQAAIGWGDHFMRAWHDMVIFGSIYTREDAKQACINAGGSEEECSWEDERLAESYERGYRFGWAYSVVVPDGEPGSTHIASMVPITAEQFAEAKEDGWDVEKVSNRPWFVQAALLIVAEAREHGQL